MNVQHSMRSDSWGTPQDVIYAVRQVLGTIDLDPASSEFWNLNVGASRYLKDGLTDTAWCDPAKPETVYLNPPGGKVKNRSKSGLFWERLMREVVVGGVKEAIFMAFSAEALQSTQNKGVPSIMQHTFRVPSKRLRFLSPGVEATSPSHSNVIVYVRGTVDNTALFRKVFKQFGEIK